MAHHQIASPVSNSYNKSLLNQIYCIFMGYFLSHCTSPTVLQERVDKELRGVSAETESAAAAATGANGVSDVTGSGEEAAGGDSDKVEPVIDSVIWKPRLHFEP